MRQNFITSAIALLLFIFLASVLFNSNPAISQQVSIDPHKEEECSNCHKLVTSLEANGFSITNEDCLKCHNPAEAKATISDLNFHSDRSRNCLDCHNYHNKSLLNANKTSFKFDFENPSLRMQCSSCHDESVNINKISNAHREAAVLYHNDDKYLGHLSPSESCMSCHSKTAGSANKVSSGYSAPQFYQHATHPIGQKPIGFNIKSQIDPKIKLFGEKIECQTCHNLSSDKKNHISYFEEEYDICLGCHNLNQPRK